VYSFLSELLLIVELWSVIKLLNAIKTCNYVLVIRIHTGTYREGGLFQDETAG